MSRWLRSVNNLLEQLDGQAENVSESVETVEGAFSSLLNNNGQQDGFGSSDSDPDSISESDSSYDDEKIQQNDSDGSIASEENDSEKGEEALKVNEEVKEMLDDSKQPDAGGIERTSTPVPLKPTLEPRDMTIHDVEKSLKVPVESPAGSANAPSVDSRVCTNSPPSRMNSFDNSPSDHVQSPQASDQSNKKVNIDSVLIVPPEKMADAESKDNVEIKQMEEKLQSLQAQLKQMASELELSQVDCKKAKKESLLLSSRLEEVNKEITAQRDELDRAADQMEKERRQLQEEREELLDEQDEEIDQLKQQYESLLDELRQQLESEEQKRIQEGGNWTSDLKDAMERERSALSQLAEAIAEKEKIEKSFLDLQATADATQKKLDESVNAVEVAAKRELEAENKLDSAISTHAHQMAQRQAREAELEKTIFDLGAALTKQNEEAKGQQKPVAETINYKEHLQQCSEELQTAKTRLAEEVQWREALQQQLNEISNERAAEESQALNLQRRYDQKIADLELVNSRLSATIREYEVKESSLASRSIGNSGHQAADAERYKKDLMKASEQLLHHQQRAESYKSEILTLKGRLQSANKKVEEAEVRASLASNSTSNVALYEMESGGLGYSRTTARRRVKGGMSSSRRNSTQVRSIRSALRLNPGRVGPLAEQVASTIDALDKWMVDTGAFLRHEPLARFGCLIYFITLHLWSFALVVFHTTEQPHADFGSMDTNPRHWRPR